MRPEATIFRIVWHLGSFCRLIQQTLNIFVAIQDLMKILRDKKLLFC